MLLQIGSSIPISVRFTARANETEWSAARPKKAACKCVETNQLSLLIQSLWLSSSSFIVLFLAPVPEPEPEPEPVPEVVSEVIPEEPEVPEAVPEPEPIVEKKKEKKEKKKDKDGNPSHVVSDCCR